MADGTDRIDGRQRGPFLPRPRTELPAEAVALLIPAPRAVPAPERIPRTA